MNEQLVPRSSNTCAHWQTAPLGKYGSHAPCGPCPWCEIERLQRVVREHGDEIVRWTVKANGEAPIVLDPMFAASEADLQRWRSNKGSEVAMCLREIDALRIALGNKPTGNETNAEPSLLNITRGQIDFTTAVTGNARMSGLTKAQFLHMVILAWDARDALKADDEVYTQEGLDSAHERTRERLAKLKVDDGSENGGPSHD